MLVRHIACLDLTRVRAVMEWYRLHFQPNKMEINTSSGGE